MDDLIAFLNARLDEDEQVARAAANQHQRAVDAFKSSRPADVDDLPGESPADWSGGPDEDGRGRFRRAVWAGEGMATICEMHDEYDEASPAHIARHDPARVLADVEAKRRLILFLTDLRHDVNGQDPWYTCEAASMEHDGGEPVGAWAGLGCSCGRDDRVREGLTLLALPFAGHPDYQEAWTP